MEKNHFKKAEEIINSIDDIQQASVPDFFYTRLKARMEKEMPVSVNRKRKLQPVLIISGLVALLLANAMILFKNEGSSIGNTGNNDNQQIVATEYHINDILTEDLNQ